MLNNIFFVFVVWSVLLYVLVVVAVLFLLFLGCWLRKRQSWDGIEAEKQKRIIVIIVGAGAFLLLAKTKHFGNNVEIKRGQL